MSFGLSKEDWNQIETLLLQPLKKENAKVYIFGSRARGDHKKFSDLDVLVEKTKELPVGLLSQIKENLEESHLPIKVDVVLREYLASSYVDSVEKDKVQI